MIISKDYWWGGDSDIITKLTHSFHCSGWGEDWTGERGASRETWSCIETRRNHQGTLSWKYLIKVSYYNSSSRWASIFRVRRRRGGASQQALEVWDQCQHPWDQLAASPPLPPPPSPSWTSLLDLPQHPQVSHVSGRSDHWPVSSLLQVAPDSGYSSNDQDTMLIYWEDVWINE